MTQDGRNGAQHGHGQGPVPGAPGGHGQGPGGAVPGPLVQEYESSGRFRRPSVQVAAVLMYENGGHSVVWPDHREDVNRPLFRGAFKVMEVRVGRHLTEFRTELPAAGDAESFRAEVQVRWRVVDAYAAVRANVWDLAQYLSPVLLRGLRGVTRRYRISEAERADRAVENELADLRLGHELGLETEVFVRIDLSERGISAERQRTEIDHEGDLARRQHVEALRKERQEQELIRMRATELQDMLSGGDEGQLAYFMARDAAHAWDIQQAFRRERREERALSIETVFRFVDGGLIERHDLNDQTLAAIDLLRSTTRGVVGRAADTFLEQPPRRRALESGEPRGEQERVRGRQRMDWAHEPDPEADPEAGPEAEPDFAPDSGRGSGRGSGRDSALDDAPERDRDSGPGRETAYDDHEPGRRGRPDGDGYADDRYADSRSADDRYADRRDAPHDDELYEKDDRGRVYEPDRVQSAAERDDYRTGRPGDFPDDRYGERYDDRYDDRRDDRRDARRDDRYDDHRDDRERPAPRRGRGEGLDWGK
ncbi:hypothetical protein [Streptomyces monomycini]|uniref:hypothetical protein n=1 Tax=Streptomyces monomycini TaxID=371720 RepID=UPI00067B472E|nr:hypothetical protein [Streptomyces monomycini]